MSAEFQYIDPKPLASASVAQVHRAKLRTGEEVVLKVRTAQDIVGWVAAHSSVICFLHCPFGLAFSRLCIRLTQSLVLQRTSAARIRKSQGCGEIG